jgi:hypothetical protein
MKAQLPFVYYVDCLTGQRDVQRRPQIGMHDCDIAEVAIGETEQVASWGWMLYGHTREPRRQGACIRWNDNLYVPITDETHVRHLNPAVVGGKDWINGRPGIDTFMSMYRGIASADQRLWHLSCYLEGKRSKFSKPKADRVVGSTEAADLNVIAEMADGLLVSDNRMWQKALGLHLRVKERGEQGDRDVTSLQIDYSKDGGRTWAEDFWLNSHRQVCIHRASLNDHPHVEALTTQVQRPEFYHLEIYDEAAFVFDGRSEYLGRAVKELIATAGEEIGNFSADKVKRWLDVREDVLALLVDEDADAEAAFTALASLSDNPRLRGSVAQALKSLAVYDDIELRRATRRSPLIPRSP